MITSVKWAPLFSRVLIAAVVGILFFHFSANFKSSQLLNVAGVLAGVSGTLLGFLITAVALLTAVMDRRLVANMRKTGHYQRLVSETFATCIGLFATTVLCIVALLFTDLALTMCFCSGGLHSGAQLYLRCGGRATVFDHHFGPQLGDYAIALPRASRQTSKLDGWPCSRPAAPQGRQ